MTSLKQLTHIGYYMKDFKAIIDQFNPNAKQDKYGKLALEGVGEARSESDDDWVSNFNFARAQF